MPSWILDIEKELKAEWDTARANADATSRGKLLHGKERETEGRALQKSKLLQTTVGTDSDTGETVSPIVINTH